MNEPDVVCEEEKMIDKKFPEDEEDPRPNPTYYEISKIIQLEKERRHRNLT